MSELLFGMIGLFLGTLLGAGLTGGLTYSLRLRRELKAAHEMLKAWQMRPQPEPPTQQPISRFDTPSKFDNPPPAEPRFSGIGPADIASRELWEHQQAEKKSTPPFASPATLNPSLNDIRDAATEATNGKVN